MDTTETDKRDIARSVLVVILLAMVILLLAALALLALGPGLEIGSLVPQVT